MRIVLATLTALAMGVPANAQALRCDLSGFTAAPGLAAAVAADTLTVTWDGDQNQEARLRFTIVDGTPTIRDLAVRAKGLPRQSPAGATAGLPRQSPAGATAGGWKIAGSNMTPEFRVAAGFRRVTEQQLQPLRQLKVEITPEIVEKYKWDAFWDAPLNTNKLEKTRDNAIPPPGGVAGQPGLPRNPDEITRASATYQATSCEVSSSGARLMVSFPGVALGPFDGRLQYTVFKGSNLIAQEVIAKTDKPSVAYKYEAGLKGLPITATSRIVWRDMANTWQDYRFGGAPNSGPVTLKASNRLVVAESGQASIAAFPPPHNFFWSRETSSNLGYVWYQKNPSTSLGASGTFAFGVRQPDHEADPSETGRGDEDTSQNFALRSARPGTWQHMPVYLYVSAGAGTEAARGALAFTRDDKFKAVPGYQVMATHFHSALVGRLRRMHGGDLDVRLPDLDVVRAAGINIFAPIDGGGLGYGAGQASDRLAVLADYYEVAKRHSDKNFLIMPNEEGAAGGMGGHNDLLISKPVFWLPRRAQGQPLVEQHPKYGKVYNIGSPLDMLEFVKAENLLVFMPHPRSKGSTGYPEAIKDTPWFNNEHYRGIGVRWGMGLDGSEMRLCEYRCQQLWDEMNNWVADTTPLKYINAITETYQLGPGDDVYANSPVNYVKVDALPAPGDYTPIIEAMKRGDYFWTSGEVLVPSYEVQGTGAKRTIVADVEWTFPLEFVEVVWGDGVKTDRQIIRTSDAGAFGRKRFSIPFDATGRKWVRFAAWDAAGNGAMVQPVKLTASPETTTR